MQEEAPRGLDGKHGGWGGGISGCFELGTNVVHAMFWSRQNDEGGSAGSTGLNVLPFVSLPPLLILSRQCYRQAEKSHVTVWVSR